MCIRDRYNTAKIKNFAKKINADIIISNWPQGSFSGAKMLNSEVPIMFINHTHGGVGGSILGLMKNIMNKNHSCYMVSEWQHNQYKLLANIKNADDVVIDGYTSIGKNNLVYPFTVLGSTPQHTKYKGEKSELIIGNNNIMREHVTMHPGTEVGIKKTIVGNNGLFMVGCHIAHDSIVGDNVAVSYTHLTLPTSDLV